MSIAADESKTVRLNVGGTFYQVPRSLLESHPNTMLASMVSEPWSKKHKNNDNARFIDRNGDRFQYVLDFLRDHQVHLPMTISKNAFLQDLEYYGFEMDDEEKHSLVLQGSLAAAIQIMGTVEENADQDIKDLDESILKHKNEITLCNQKKAAIKLAQLLVKLASTSNNVENGRVTVSLEKGPGEGMFSSSEKNTRYKLAGEAYNVKEYLKERLLEYGFTLEKFEEDKVNYTRVGFNFVLQRQDG